MIEAYTPEAVYAAERVLMERLAEGELMSRAVDGLAQITAIRLAERRGRRVVALVGLIVVLKLL